MTRDSRPAYVLLAFFVVLLAVGARIGGSPTEVPTAARAATNHDVGAELTLTGIVVGTLRVHRASSPVIVMLRTDRRSYDLVLAPASYMADAGLTLIKGDHIVVTGASGRLNDEDVVFVREITTGTRTVALRSECGDPLWPMP